MPDAIADTPHACPMGRRRVDPKRIWLAGVGVLSVGVGALGVVLPGLPTTIFLIIASWCFARSCPWLEERLIRNRFFRPFLVCLDPGEGMPLRARVVSTVMLWVAVLISVTLLLGGEISIWVPVAVAASGFVGTYAIWRVGRPRPAPAREPASRA